MKTKLVWNLLMPLSPCPLPHPGPYVCYSAALKDMQHHTQHHFQYSLGIVQTCTEEPGFQSPSV